ncbi:fructosamine kinase family protein [Vibrio mangrovi]|uniref:Fructosamine kinase n=1 Tax=Vibrio mangrovi TaxID=474394 RepID=A0A1Y6INC6_9VIBR|nr:fructosamine kinase family protein [Vibrio mangrovi]MDW6004056.1 fructosamine kinase family protein [Vibrio mangrovi]SMR99146.1 Fructosamine kinase [Vibrio mangrovi]
MWQGIVQQLSLTLGREFQILDKQRIHGGDINASYVISDGRYKYFVKINEKEDLSQFICEQDNLRTLAQTHCVNTPKVLLVGSSKSHSFLVLQHISLKPLESGERSYLFGEQLARLHQWGEQKEYGFDQDNYIGMTIQPNSWNKKWHRFFAEQRIGWQLQLLYEKGIVFIDIDKFVELIAQQLAHHQPKPSLLHGDLWHGNVADSGLEPFCFDPACYWGDRECDIAMTELFGGFEPEFYQGYESILPLELAYEERKHIYNLYHILNHCNCFGGHYLNDAQQIIRNILEESS